MNTQNKSLLQSSKRGISTKTDKKSDTVSMEASKDTSMNNLLSDTNNNGINKD